ncbi:hypothetical protein Ancab_005635 [Ancistrocladus abbreviatus]
MGWGKSCELLTMGYLAYIEWGRRKWMGCEKGKWTRPKCLAWGKEKDGPRPKCRERERENGWGAREGKLDRGGGRAKKKAIGWGRGKLG